ncbi:MAG: heme biosynthesis HemY N-terminal domain-containing protein, partial [Woeseia sp.]
VVIQFRGYLVEMSVPALTGLLLLLLIGIWMIVKILRVPRKLGEAAGRYRSNRAGSKLTRGLIAVAEGNFAKGEKLLSRSAGVSDAPLLNYLEAARAAHLQGNKERRDDWLRQAFEKMPDAKNAVLLTQAELQLDSEEYEQALATLRKLDENSPNHSYALALMGKLYYRLKDWKQLQELLPRIQKHGRVDEDVLLQWTIKVYSEELRNAAEPQVAWKAVPRKLKKHEELLEAYAAALIASGEQSLAEKSVSAALNRSWHGGLVRLYGNIKTQNTTLQLKQAERWLKNHPEDPDLLLSSAKLSLRNELWGKARSYLEAAIAIRPTPDAYQEYGRLLHQLGEGDAAAEAYRSGLGLVTPLSNAAIPWLGPDPQQD